MSIEDEKSNPTPDGLSLPISALANDQVVYAEPSATITEAATTMTSEGIGLLVIKSGDSIEGVVSERDIIQAVADRNDLNSPVSSLVHNGKLLRAAPTSSISDVAEEMMENYVRHVLVAGPGNEVAGVVSMRDLLAALVG